MPKTRLGILAALLASTLTLPATAGHLTWDMSAVGLPGSSSFSADALKATEVSHIMFTGPTTWIEHGFAKITGVLNGGVQSVPTGLNSDYSLYFDFTATGDLMTGTIDTLAMTLYGVAGVANFGLDASNNAFVDNGANLPLALATITFLKGTIGGAPGTDLSANIWGTFAATKGGAPAFLSPSLPAPFYGKFFHPVSEPGGITLVADGIVLNGGDDTLQFVPEPSSLALLASGLTGALWLRRRR
ncbi:MAG: flocculation-associated PEP-CTERM protein PepA [Acidobacteria bacterium]|nr:flocculation-associated PEP-CTERM protein PepA [Acidobacteriota bacterium]